MSYLCQECKIKMGASVSVLEIIEIQGFIVKNAEGDSTEANGLSHIL